MCAIAGIVSYHNQAVDISSLKLMANAMHHRGIDGEGFWVNTKANVGFAHKRLSIIDLSNNAAQPMHYLQYNNSPKYTLVFNGEIYNYIELKKDLIKKGYTFYTNSDTEVLLALYDYYNTSCLNYIDGMFAFAIWDNITEQIFIARDRFGEKPLYYFSDKNQFIFSSEMKALWAVGVSKTINNAMLLNYLSVGMVSNPNNAEETFYNNIKKLPAAHYVLVDTKLNNITTTKYWSVNFNSFENKLNQNEVVDKFLFLFNQSVERRLRSDVAVSTSLSGGLDSSSIISSIAKIQNYNSKELPISFSAVFPGFSKDESQYIKQVTDYFSIKNFTTTPTAENFASDFEKLLFHQEEPFQSSSIYVQYKVYELAKENNIKVLLDGQGADETLAGYSKYYFWYWQSLLNNFKVNTFLYEKSKAKQNNHTISWSINNIIAAFFPYLASKKLSANLKNNIQAKTYFNKNFVIDNINLNSFQKPIIKNLNQILYYNTCINGLEDLLRYADRNSMAHGVEVRLPFLNVELVEFMLSLPEQFKINNGFTKYILREAMQNKLPETIVWRKDKIGFEPPQKQWLQHKVITDYTQNAKENLIKAGIFKKNVLDMKFNVAEAHEANNMQWWTLCAGTLFK